jgi:hypothetical protein
MRPMLWPAHIGVNRDEPITMGETALRAIAGEASLS